MLEDLLVRLFVALAALPFLEFVEALLQGALSHLVDRRHVVPADEHVVHHTLEALRV